MRQLSSHPNIILLEEVLFDRQTGSLALVFELMSGNLYEVIRDRKEYLDPKLIRSYMYQMLKGLEFVHKKGFFHRDIKPENMLLDVFVAEF